VGFAESEGLFPYPRHSFPGYRLLQEYFTLPHKFLFVDVALGDVLSTLEPERHFDLVFHFRERPPEELRVSVENLRLHCSPVVNLMEKDADPIRLDHKQSYYLLRPSDPEPNHFEIYSVDSVTGLVTGTSKRQEYLPFYAFRHGVEPDDPKLVYYKLRRKPAVGKPNSDCYLGFVSVHDRGVLPEAEIASVELTCTNRRMAEALKPGDLTRHTDRSPQFAEFQNITQLTVSAIPPLGGGFHWRLISHLALNLVSLSDAEALRALLSLYDFAALQDKQAARSAQRRLESISDLRARPCERIFRGAVMRGIETTLELQEDRFSSEGELYLFASVLDEFLALYVTVNAFSQLRVHGAQQGELYEWPARVGRQFTL
jgi:type VI secretion system protein ImpG